MGVAHDVSVPVKIRLQEKTLYPPNFLFLAKAKRVRRRHSSLRFSSDLTVVLEIIWFESGPYVDVSDDLHNFRGRGCQTRELSSVVNM